MQYLTDIIKELIHGQLGFFTRGIKVGYDFTAGDFIKDNAWHDLDLSSIIPADARAVLVRLRLRATVIGKAIRFVTKGETASSTTSMSGTLTANSFHWYDITVVPDSNLFVEYRVSVATWINLDVTVAGWWLR